MLSSDPRAGYQSTTPSAESRRRLRTCAAPLRPLDHVCVNLYAMQVLVLTRATRGSPPRRPPQQALCGGGVEEAAQVNGLQHLDGPLVVACEDGPQLQRRLAVLQRPVLVLVPEGWGMEDMEGGSRAGVEESRREG